MLEEGQAAGEVGPRDDLLGDFVAVIAGFPAGLPVRVTVANADGGLQYQRAGNRQEVFKVVAEPVVLEVAAGQGDFCRDAVEHAPGRQQVVVSGVERPAAP